MAKKLRFYVARKKSGRRYATIVVKLLRMTETMDDVDGGGGRNYGQC